ncbi:hypothetical protein RA086_09650 [Lactiplantibacillus sp. WILCCON 0030]|uniref:Integral membrane protein n=1 Tax=Lactiplantibacillus brownii TaxID=3069269 RepID=A0ABU1AAC4_9LACO|nr:hypothetical protein [Lactiplantibacillus brownii]MDQ7937870.1 hypothetical protein [Lactiplantibacillus brownii]
MVHSFFYSVMLILFLLGLLGQWVYRAYFQLLLMVHSIEILFMGVVGWYTFGPMIILPLLGLWLTGLVIIYMMNRFPS